jgi:hypothetical protein
MLVLVVLTMSFAAASCGDDGGEPITFGEGEIPSAFPDDLPVPPGAVIGSTLVDRVNHRSEYALAVPLDVTATIQFYLVELVNAGYVVETSEGTGSLWTITYSRGDLAGDLSMQPQGTGATHVVASINRA